MDSICIRFGTGTKGFKKKVIVRCIALKNLELAKMMIFSFRDGC